MKTKSMNAILAMLCLLISTQFISAQETKQDGPTYFVADYMKVEPGGNSDYIKLEKTWKKIHAARVKAGQSDGWALLQVVSPSGADVEYNFVTVNRFYGNKKLAGYYEDAYMPENMEAILSKEEQAMVQKTGEYRTIVKTEVWSYQDGVFADDFDNAKIQVCNYMKNKPGHTNTDHAKIEKEIWKPVHDLRIKSNVMEGWAMYNLEFPFGTEQESTSATIDFYENMEQYLSISFPMFFKKAHPTKKMDDLMKQTSDTFELLRGEVRILLDSTDM